MKSKFILIITTFFLLNIIMVNCRNDNSNIVDNQSYELVKDTTVLTDSILFNNNQLYKSFIDSIVLTRGIDEKKCEIRKPKPDTLSEKMIFSCYEISINGNFFIQNCNDTLPKKNSKDSSLCVKYFKLNYKVELLDTNHCGQIFDFTKGSELTFNDNSYVFGIGNPFLPCIGGGCRLRTYPVFVFNHIENVTDFRFFEYPNDITGLRYGDLNQDGYLDFLEVSPSMDKVGRKLIEKYRVAWENFYRIEIVTFKDGIWQKLKDKQGNLYYIFLVVEDSLNPNTKFRIISKNWFIE